ncbi:MAG: DUF374 domain-containing protein [Fibrobacteraceae bacterium]|nr:DUF374 domain-containing protein [Fibrobacteraceae bacterium]
MLKDSLKMRFFHFLAIFWLKSLRIHGDKLENHQPGILGIWHEDLAATTAAFAHKNVHAMISSSKDGDIFTNLAESLGYKIVRGSDSLHAESIRHLVKPLKNNSFVAMALDGPKGPARQKKPGTAWLSQKTNRPLYEVKVTYGLHFQLHSWDKSKIPFPFSKVTIKIQQSS